MDSKTEPFVSKVKKVLESLTPFSDELKFVDDEILKSIKKMTFIVNKDGLLDAEESRTALVLDKTITNLVRYRKEISQDPVKMLTALENIPKENKEWMIARAKSLGLLRQELKARKHIFQNNIVSMETKINKLPPTALELKKNELREYFATKPTLKEVNQKLTKAMGTTKSQMLKLIGHLGFEVVDGVVQKKALEVTSKEKK